MLGTDIELTAEALLVNLCSYQECKFFVLFKSILRDIIIE